MHMRPELKACVQIVHREHTWPERVSQPHEGKGEDMETWNLDPHLSQGPSSHPQWQSVTQIAYRESIPNAMIGDPTNENIGNQSYIPNLHQQSRGQPYPRSQQHMPWNQNKSQNYDEMGVLGVCLQNWKKRLGIRHIGSMIILGI